jgi:pathogenesis-related protein 1
MKYFFLIISLMATFSAGAQVVKTGSLVPPAEALAALDYHNAMRAEVGSGPLRWSESLSVFAQAWADHLVSISCKIQHRPSTGEWAQEYGENIFWGNGRYFDATEASKNWYSEKKDFVYGPITPSNYGRVGHYTQMMWRNTTDVGIGMAQCKSGAYIIVANYSPRGNYINEKPY